MNQSVVLVLLLFFLVTPAFPSRGEQGPDHADYSYGEVVKATDNDLDVLEYDYEMDKEQIVHYSVNADTALTNVRQVAQLAQGDAVEVYFRDLNGARMAQTIVKDGPADPPEDAMEPSQASVSSGAALTQ